MRIVFLGTPDFAVPALSALADAGHEIALVVTQPDRPRGRGGKVSFSAVKEEALRRGITVFQPKKIREESAAERLRDISPDCIVVAAFGQILPKEILDLPAYGCLNIHASLLPKYRGAAPIQWAILSGEEETGVTIMQMDEGLDTGDILAQEKVPISPQETGGSLFDRLSEKGADLLIRTLAAMEKGAVMPCPQDDAKATRTGKIDKTLGEIEWAREAVATERLVRAMDPWPSAYTWLEGKILKIWKAEVVPGDPAGHPGQVLAADPEQGFVIQTGEGALKLLEVQQEGRRRMEAGAFLRGCPVETGIVVG